MDQDNSNWYKSLSYAMPYLVLGFVISLPLNALLIQAIAKTSTSYLGWPFDAATLVNGETQLEIVGLVANIIVWTFLLAVVSFALLKVFKKS